MASGSCMASAAEDGQGHQTNGVKVSASCGVNQSQKKGCPPQPQWQGPNTGYYNIPGEPFANIPTYYQNWALSGSDEENLLWCLL